MPYAYKQLAVGLKILKLRKVVDLLRKRSFFRLHLVKNDRKEVNDKECWKSTNILEIFVMLDVPQRDLKIELSNTYSLPSDHITKHYLLARLIKSLILP